MFLAIGLLGIAFLFSFVMGYQRILRLRDLTRKRILNGLITAIIILTLITAGQWLGFFSQEVGTAFTMLLYSIAGGFFTGFATRMILLRRKIKTPIYVYRSFWTDIAPKIIGVLLIAFGIYRTGFLSPGLFTGIGITSGVSLIGFGFFGLSIRIVPEFHHKGILILDQFVPWKKVVAYQWDTENALRIDYYNGTDKLTDFTTFIPAEDELTVEQLLADKLKHHEQERQEMMHDKE